MGHARLGPLPQTREWQEVVDLLNAKTPLKAVAQQSALAMRVGLRAGERDDGVVEVLYLLAELPRAARGTTHELGALLPGLPDRASVTDLLGAFAAAIDGRLGDAHARTTIGELAQLSAIETLADSVYRATGQLLEPRPDEVRQHLRALDTPYQFGARTRAFIARLSARLLNFYLSRELGQHVGKTFASVDHHTAFDSALRRHCYEAAAIVEVYSGQWRSKKQWTKSLTRTETRRFARTAMAKLNAELTRRDGEDVR